MADFNLSDLKPLTSAARDDARRRALRRVQKLAGKRPARAQFTIDHTPLVGVLDWLAAFVFLSALLISSLNIIAHMGRLASAAYTASPEGIHITRPAATVIFQTASVPLAEFSMIAFLVAFGLAQGWRRWVYLFLAALATAFILVANLSSHVGVFEAVLPAAFTIGTGLRLEHLLAEQLRRREDVQRRYRDALAVWERAQGDPVQHPAYPALLREELWSKLAGYTANKPFVDAPADFKRAAVGREIAAMQWAHDVRPTSGAESANHPNDISAAKYAEPPLPSNAAHGAPVPTNADNGRGAHA